MEVRHFTSGVDLGWVFCAHYEFLCSINQSSNRVVQVKFAELFSP